MSSDADRLGAELEEIKRRLADVETRQIRLPFLDQDPGTDEPANIWGFGDRRLRVRLPDGGVSEFRPYDQPYIPTLSSDPAASTGISIWINSSTGELRARTAGGTVQRFAPVTTSSSTTSTTSSSTSSISKPTVLQPKTIVTKWSAAWGASYRQNGTKRTENNHLYYGRVESYNGTQRSLFGFSGAVQTALAGSTPKKVELYLYNLHAYYNAGVDITIWGHNFASEPAASPGVGTAIGTFRFPDGGDYAGTRDGYVTLPLAVGAKLLSGAYKGFSLYRASTSNAYYGYARGVSDGGAPILRVTYVK